MAAAFGDTDRVLILKKPSIPSKYASLRTLERRWELRSCGAQAR
jgi:hypothetical protein